MTIENLNQYTFEQLVSLKNTDKNIVLLIKEQPDVSKIMALKESIIKDDTSISLVISSNNNNLIKFSDFEYISNNVTKLLLLNRNEILNSIEGISIFCNLNELSITDLYSNKIDLNELQFLGNFEELYLLYNNLSKVHHKILGNLKKLKKLTVKGLDLNLLPCLNKLETLTCYGLKNGTNLNIKAPSLKHLIIYRSPQIKDLTFLSNLQNITDINLDGLSNIEEIPNLSNLHHLQSLTLANMKRLKYFPIHHDKLKGLLINENIPLDALNNITPYNLPNLNEIHVHLGSDKKSNIILNRFRK